MQAYKFGTKISESGTISLPYVFPNLYGIEVELFIVPKEEAPIPFIPIKKQARKNLWIGGQDFLKMR